MIPAPRARVRPLYWSVRRELWEHRSLTIAPLAVAGVFLVGFLISAATLSQRLRALAGQSPGAQHEAITLPYSAVVGLLVATAFVVGFVYCVDALHGERRDRSILFWKSLPVSDLVTVVAKASIPLVVLPLYVFAIAVAAKVLVLLIGTVALLGDAASLTLYWSHSRLPSGSVALLYALAAIALWHAPLYAWLLLVSAWARRAPLLWAVLPPVAVFVLERTAFGTAYAMTLVRDRLLGWYALAFVEPAAGDPPLDPLAALAPTVLLGAPDLWIGLLVAALFLGAAGWLRRGREPI